MFETLELRPKAGELFGELKKATAKNRDTLKGITDTIDPLLPEDKRPEPISRKALWILASTPGVTSVLNGMRTTQYVNDTLTILGWDPLTTPRNVFESLIRP